MRSHHRNKADEDLTMPLSVAAERGLQELPIFAQPRGDHGPKCEGRAAEALSNRASPSQRDNTPLQH
eukprot:4791377-Pyramimonas_sp.AAC.1